MTTTMPRLEARDELESLLAEVDRNPETPGVTITRHGKPVLAVLPWDLYESIVETLEVMSDPDLMAAIRQDIQDRESGTPPQTYSLEEVKRELGL